MVEALLAGSWSRCQDSDLGQFVRDLHERDGVALGWLTYFAARRALTQWEDYCESARPREIVEAIGRHLTRGERVDWRDASRATPSPCVDCSRQDTQGASDAIAGCAAYLHSGDPRKAAECLSAADCSYYDHPCFRAWLLYMALPAALEKRELTAAEWSLDLARVPSTFVPGLLDAAQEWSWPLT